MVKSTKPRTYDVGYGRPPRHTRYQKGKSGNPRGRPKNRKDMRAEIHDVYHKELTLTDANGKKSKVPAFAALLQAHLIKGLKGDARSMLALFRLAERLGLHDVLPRSPTVGEIIHHNEFLELLDDRQLKDYLRAIHEGRAKIAAGEKTTDADFLQSLTKRRDQE